MSADFSKVIYVDGQPEIAKVNRADKTLFISSKIWKGLPADQREFVLLHERGHLDLKTADEYAANAYAVGKFAPVRTLTNAELGQRIVVMRNILTPRESGFLTDAISGALTSITNVLPVLGIGSKSRIAENEQLLKAQAKKDNTNIIIMVLVGVFLIAGVTLYFTLRK